MCSIYRSATIRITWRWNVAVVMETCWGGKPADVTVTRKGCLCNLRHKIVTSLQPRGRIIRDNSKDLWLTLILEPADWTTCKTDLKAKPTERHRTLVRFLENFLLCSNKWRSTVYCYVSYYQCLYPSISFYFQILLVIGAFRSVEYAFRRWCVLDYWIEQTFWD